MDNFGQKAAKNPRSDLQGTGGPRQRSGPSGVGLPRKSGRLIYSLSESWRIGEMEGVEGKTISTPLAVA